MPIIITRGPKDKIDQYIPLPGELAIDTDEYILRLGDGNTRGGIYISQYTSQESEDTTIQSSSKLLTFEDVLIESGNKCRIPQGKLALGGVAQNICYVRDPNKPYILEYYCCIDTDSYDTVVISSDEDLSGSFATFTILTEAIVSEQSQLITVDREIIVEDKIELPSPTTGDVILNTAQVYETADSQIMLEYSCKVNSDGTYVEFDPNDNLSGKYATFTYLKTPVQN